MTAKDYPITTSFGWIYGYPLNVNTDGQHPGQGFHKGRDYGCPDGTAIVVNDVQIGVSGHTGAVTGPHTHVGKWFKGTVYDPGDGGWTLNNPRVTDIGFDGTNGNYVGLLDGDGVRWVYLHMQEKSTNVQVGDHLDTLPKYNDKGGNVTYPNTGDLKNIYDQTGFPGHFPNENDIAYWTAGTNNPDWDKGADEVQKALLYQVITYVGQNANTNAAFTLDQIKKLLG